MTTNTNDNNNVPLALEYQQKLNHFHFSTRNEWLAALSVVVATEPLNFIKFMCSTYIPDINEANTDTVLSILKAATAAGKFATVAYLAKMFGLRVGYDSTLWRSRDGVVDRISNRNIAAVLRSMGAVVDSELEPDVKLVPEVTKQSEMTSETLSVPLTITDKNMAEDIHVFFRDLGDMDKINWPAQLTSAITTGRPLHIVKELFIRSQGQQTKTPEQQETKIPGFSLRMSSSLPLSMSDKLDLIEKSLKAKKSDVTRFLLQKEIFDMDVQTMQTSCSSIKWGDLSMYDPELCKEIIELFDLPGTCFGNSIKDFGINNLPILTWILDRFKFCADGKWMLSHDMIVNWLETPAKEFSQLIGLLSIDNETSKMFLGRHAEYNVLWKCVFKNKMEHFDILVKRFNVSKYELQLLFKRVVSDESFRPDRLTLDFVKHFLLE